MSINKLKNSLILTFASTLLFVANPSFAAKKDVQIGVLALWGEKIALEMWQPTIKYLNKTIPTHHFLLKPLKLVNTAEAVQKQRIDFIITNPGNYIDLEARFHISRLATLKTKKQNQTSSQFGAVIFTRYDRNDIQSLDDLRNKSFMGVKKKAFGGFQMAWLELKNVGIDPFEDFSSLQFSGFPQDKIVYAVLNKNVDAGTVRTSTLERMAAEGLIDINHLKVINNKYNKNFPFLHSTPLYPEWPIAKIKDTSTELSKKVTIALLELPADSAIARKAKSSGWTVPLDYFPVQNLFKELNLEPYKVTLPSFLERYWLQSLLFLLLFLQPLILYIIKLKIDSRHDKDKLAQAETEWSNALDFLDEPMYMVDLEDRIIRANKAFYKKIQSTPENAIGKVVTDFTHPEGEESPCKVCMARKNFHDTVLTLEKDDPINKAGVPTEISVKIIRDKNNQPIGVIQRMRDLTESRKAEKALRRSESLFKELLNATPEPLIVANADGTIVLSNSQFEKEFGYSREEIVGHKIETLIPIEQQAKHIKIRSEYISQPNVRPMGQDIKLEALHKDGHIFPVDVSLSPFSVDNEVLIIATVHNISKRIAKEAELKRLASFPEFSPNPIIEFTKEGTVTYANPASSETFPEISQQGFKHEIFDGLESQYPSIEDNYELIRNISVGNSTFEQKIIYSKETNLFRMYIWDITKLRNLTKKMSYQASHDALTKLVNRREFERRLEQIVAEAQQNNSTHTLCYMDLDQFKAVNDSCGHAAGDELLKQLSSILNATIRETDTLARLGGDEFGLLLVGCSTSKASMIAEGIRKVVEEFRFHWNNKTFKVGISIGIVTINGEKLTVKDIQSAADTACYIAKEQGRNRVHVYDTNSTATTKHTNDTNWLNRINNALDNNDFILYFQKIASLNNQMHEHYEVLIRMIDEDGKTIPPNSFIPAAERFNIMSSVDSWVIHNTLLIMQENRHLNINFSVNLSGQSLGDLKFMENCISQIESSSINPNRICFEITETAMIANLADAIRSISILRGLGCKIALDDFGSGLSSFAYLKNLPVDYLKIDGSLIKDMENDPVNITMVKSIIHIAKSMKLETIAEYVENDTILNILKELEIDYVQGYGIAKPLSLEEIYSNKNKQLG